MHRSQQARRRSSNVQSRLRGSALVSAIDALECRRLFSGETLSTPISPILADVTNPSANSFALDQFFTDSTLPGTLATFTTNLGTITVALTDAATPLTVANFLNYVDSGAYTDTIFHRSAVLSANGSGGSPSTPADIIQGGGYVINGREFEHIPTNAAINDEYTTGLQNSAGTLAMAKTSMANSATSEWYFNVHDNTTTLDPPTTDSNGVTTSYTVFGTVLTGMNVVDEIAALPSYNISSNLSTVPVIGLSPPEVTHKYPITAANLVYTKSITAEPGTNFTVTSNNNALVTPRVTDGTLSFTYGSGLSGTADITIVAKNLDGTSASTTFAVTVPNSATPTAGPVAANISAPSVVTGTTGTIILLASDTDSLAGLDPTTVTITTQPAHGTATVNTSTGAITYTPTAGFTGTDSLAYTVADDMDNVSNVATVTLTVVPPPVSVTIGTATAKSLTFTQPSGATGHLIINGGTAVVTFASSQVTTTTAGGILTATGAGATIASVVITNHGPAASIVMTSTGAVTLGSITDAGAVSILNAPTATLTGTSRFKSIGRVITAAATNATLALGSGSSTTLVIPNVTNTTVTDTGSIASITSTQWQNSNGGFYTVTASRIGRLQVAGTFADALNLTGTGNSLAVAKVGQASAAWTITGAVGNAAFTAPTSTWSLATNGSIGNLVISGNLSSGVTAASIGSLIVTGATTGASVDTTSAKAGINKLKLGGAVASTNISSGGKITSITAPSLSTAQITADTIGSLIVSGAVTGATIATTAASSSSVQIGTVKFGGAVDTSSVTSSGKIAEVTAASLSSSQVTGGTIGDVIAPGADNTVTIRTTAAASDKVQIDQLRLGAVVSSSFSTTGNITDISAASLSSTQVAAANLGSLIVSGTTTSATVTTSAAFAKGKLEIGRLIFGGGATTTTVNSVGNIGNIVAASLTGSQIYAGVNSTITGVPSLPSITADFPANARINSVVLGNGTVAFSNTLISAQTLGLLNLGKITSSNNSTPEGVAAVKITKVLGTLVPGGTINAGPAQLKSAATLTAYETAAKLALGDFVITLI